MSSSEANRQTKHTEIETRTPIQWAEKACEALMVKFEPEYLPPDRFHYHQGVFLSGMEKCWRETKTINIMTILNGGWTARYLRTVALRSTTQMNWMIFNLVSFSLTC